MRTKIPESMMELYRGTDRLKLAERFSGTGKPTLADVNATYRFLKALAGIVGSQRKTVFRGLGTFEWRPWRGRTPTVRKGRSWRLTFKLTKSERNYNGNRR